MSPLLHALHALHRTGTAEVDYWEEVTLEDGSVCFYNHTSQEYSSALPATNVTTAIGEISSHPTGDELETSAAWGSGNDGCSERWDSQVWDGVDGEVVVPWPDEKPQDMRSSPEALEGSEGQPDPPKGQKLHGQPRSP